jgi:WD40 repeat protein
MFIIDLIIVSCGESDNKLYLSRAGDGQVISKFVVCDEDVSILDCVFSSDSTLIAFCCSDGTVGLYDIKNKEIQK